METRIDYLKDKTVVLRHIVLLTGIIVFAMSILRYYQKEYLQFIIDIFTVFTFSIMYYWIYKRPEVYTIASRIILSIGLFTISAAQFHETRHVWYPTLLLFAFFLTGRKEGWVWLIIISLSISVITPFVPHTMSTTSFYILQSTLFFIAFITNWYELNKQKILEEVKSANSYLEKGVQERTIKLNAAKIEAEKALEAKGQFLANMSHEIRTPLNAINGFISLLKEDEADPKKQEYFKIISLASYSLLQTINDILDYSKIESNNINLNNINFDSIEIKESIRLFEVQAKEKDISLEIFFAPNIPKCLNGDIQKLSQIIKNLLSNAIKFTPNSGAIRCDFSYKNGRLYTKVQDTGVGISKNKLKTIFDPFIQANNSTTREYGGTGLGLAISTSFVTIMNGTLRVKSELKKGSQFYFDIPLQEIKTKQEDTESKNDKDIKLNGHILVAEDNRANQLFMGLTLSNLGFTYEIADNGLQAVEMMRQKDYTCILMDEHMPVMSGINATKSILDIENKEGRKHTPIIALTANALEGDRERFLSAGMDDYISKPVENTILINVLKKYCKEKNV